MPFEEQEEFFGPLAIPQGMEVTPEPKEYNASILGAAFRLENEMVSEATSYTFDPRREINPDFRPWDSIQGTEYEPYGSRFAGAQDDEDIARMKAQIDREVEDRSVLDAAGWKGFAAQMGASLLSPTSLLPGGAIVRGVKGIQVGKTSLRVGTSAAAATAIQESFLQGTQQTRTPGESAFAIGGSFILGGMLGAAAGKIGQAQFIKAGKDAEFALEVTKGYDEMLSGIADGSIKVDVAEDGTLRSIGADTLAEPQRMSEASPEGSGQPPAVAGEIDELGDPVFAFHGTLDDFDVMDPAKLGTGTESEDAKLGFYFSDNPVVAEGYATVADYPSFFYKTGAAGRAYMRLNDAILKLIGAQVPKGPVMVAKLNFRNPLVWDAIDSEMTGKARADVIRYAKDAGHDAVVFQRSVDPGYTEASATPSNVYVVFAADQIEIVSKGKTATEAAALQQQLKMRRGDQSRVADEPNNLVERDADGNLRSIGAAENVSPDYSSTALELRREGFFQAINSVPVLRAIVRSDPVLRGQLSPNLDARRALVDLAETPLQYKDNETGQIVRAADGSVEGAVQFRTNTELANAVSHLHRSFAEYWKDGPSGIIGTLTAPVSARFANIARQTEKMTAPQFLEEVGKAMRSGDKHPIPQVRAAADALRANIFDRIKNDAIEVGIFDEGLSLKNAESYFSRVYNTEKIQRHFGDGTADDLKPVLMREFMNRREQAQRLLAEDDTVSRLEIDRLKTKERIQQNVKALKGATEKARAKRERAKSSIQREGAVGRVSQALRKAFQDRQAKLSEGVPDDEQTQIIKDMLADARALKRIEPTDILKEVRNLGGIKDDGSGELQATFDTGTLSYKRNKGKEPDYMREALVELGYLPDGATVDDMWQALRRATNGEKIYSIADDAEGIARYEAAQEFAAAMDDIGVDISKPFKEVLDALYKNGALNKAKASEAGRSAKAAGKKVDSAGTRIATAMDKLEEAKARLKEIDDEIGPAIRKDIAEAQKELRKNFSLLKDAKKKMSAEEFYASADDFQIEEAVMDTYRALIGLKPGEHSFSASMASPTRARTLDVADTVLEPWLESNAGVILGQYFHSMVPMVEMARRFGDVKGSSAIEAIKREAARMAQEAKTPKAKKAAIVEGQERVRDFEGMRDRILGTYGAPENPNSGWVVGGRVARTTSFMGFLGGMMIAATPDVAGVIGRGGIVDAFGAAATALTDPKRFFKSVKDAAEIGGGAEWWMNSRAQSLGETFSPYGRGSKIERIMSEGARGFSVMSGMIPWNVAWKSIGGAIIGSRMAKAAVASAEGRATTKQMLALSGNNISPDMAKRIARQVLEHSDKDGILWLPQGRLWTDPEAFEAFGKSMNREMNIMVVTPGQDKPLFMSTEQGKFFGQFKSFAISSHHRTLLAGIQRADAEVLAQVTTAIILGGLVSNIKADQGGYDRAEGSAFWENAIDRSGLAGWLMEPYNLASAATGGATSISGETVSRFQARSQGAGLMGPSIDMGLGILEASNAFASGKHSYRDVRKVMRPMPGNNIWYLLPLFQKVEDAMVSATGARPRQ